MQVVKAGERGPNQNAVNNPQIKLFMCNNKKNAVTQSSQTLHNRLWTDAGSSLCVFILDKKY